jgi:hypothetical protein
MDQPLILRIFGSLDAGRDYDPESEKRPRLMFRELGILLLEIWNAETLASWANSCLQIQHMQDVMRLGLAYSWYEETFEMMPLRYGKVIGTCLGFALECDQGLTAWDDMDFRVKVCAKIIEPLREECETFPTLR